MPTARTETKRNPEPTKARRPRSEMNDFGRRMADAMEKSEASGEKRMTVEEINRELSRRRGGMYR